MSETVKRGPYKRSKVDCEDDLTVVHDRDGSSRRPLMQETVTASSSSLQTGLSLELNCDLDLPAPEWKDCYAEKGGMPEVVKSTRFLEEELSSEDGHTGDECSDTAEAESQVRSLIMLIGHCPVTHCQS